MCGDKNNQAFSAGVSHGLMSVIFYIFIFHILTILCIDNGIKIVLVILEVRYYHSKKFNYFSEEPQKPSLEGDKRRNSKCSLESRIRA